MCERAENKDRGHFARPAQTWSRSDSLYLVAITDWHRLKVLPWRLPNTLDTEFCVGALREALHRYGTLDVFNTV